VKRIIAREGVSGLYAGLDSAVFGISVTNFVYYYWYEWMRAFFEAAATKAGRASKKLTTVESMMAGALAGSATVIMTNPIWVVNTRMTTRRESLEASQELVVEGSGAKAVQGKPRPPTTISTLMTLLREEGPRALFRGVIPALVLVINPILQYTLFEQMKNVVEARRKRNITPTIAFFLGALGKLFATSVTYPYITVKSQMHVAGNGHKEGMTQAIRRVIKEEGYSGLYKGGFTFSPSENYVNCSDKVQLTRRGLAIGIGPKVTQSVLTAAFLFAFKDVLYEQTVKLRGTVARKAVKA
jgi:adenine nucleotide transporter 17